MGLSVYLAPCVSMEKAELASTVCLLVGLLVMTPGAASPTTTQCNVPHYFYEVCGTDGTTYSNPEVAQCNGVTTQCEGSCPCKRDGRQGKTSEPANCICPAVISPVCGMNGVEYSNECAARCEGVEIDCEGECPCSKTNECICPFLHSPVCGSDGIQYGNECAANCAKTEIVCEGECPCNKSVTCVCPAIHSPVCGKNGIEYGNECAADCDGVEIGCKGECPCSKSIQCKCPFIHFPVCGKNGVGYTNECVAKCNNVEVACEGECPCEEVPL